MKAWVLLPLIFLAGLIIGGVQPRSELRRLRKDLETRKAVERRPPPQERQLASFLNMLPMDTPGRRDRTDAVNPTNAISENGTTNGVAATGLVANAVSTPQEQTPEERAAAFKEQLDKAAEAWRLRAGLARSAFAANTGFNEREMTDFDVLMTSMNVRLQDIFKQAAEQIKSGDSFTPETGVRLMNALTDAMVLTYDEMDRKLPATWRKEGGATFDLVTYVDPVVVAPLMDVQDKLPKPNDMRRNRFGNGPNPFRP